MSLCLPFVGDAQVMADLNNCVALLMAEIYLAASLFWIFGREKCEPKGTALLRHKVSYENQKEQAEALLQPLIHCQKAEA